jgi:hypothetical protein
LDNFSIDLSKNKKSASLASSESTKPQYLTTPESMSRTIKKMESDGVAKFAVRTVHIPEIEPQPFV